MIPSHPHTTEKYQEVQGTPTVPLCEPTNCPSTATKGAGVGKMCFRAIPPPPQTNFLDAQGLSPDPFLPMLTPYHNWQIQCNCITNKETGHMPADRRRTGSGNGGRTRITSSWKSRGMYTNGWYQPPLVMLLDPVMQVPTSNVECTPPPPCAGRAWCKHRVCCL